MPQKVAAYDPLLSGPGKAAPVGVSSSQPPQQHSPVAPGAYGTHQTPDLGWGNLTMQSAPFLAGYTPEAQQLALSTPVRFFAGDMGGYWASEGVDSPHNNALTSRPHLAMAQGLGGPAEATARHELGHLYDSHYGITTQTPTGLQFEDAVHPNMNPFTWDAITQRPSGNWNRPELGTVEQWGNPQELYAGMNQDPQAIPDNMRQYFPQFAPANYQPSPYQPKNTGRSEIDEQAAPDWGQPGPAADRPFMHPPPPGGNVYQDQAWRDYWHYQWPAGEDLTRRWMLNEDSPRYPPKSQGPAPAGAHWSYEFSGADQGDPGNYWVLRPDMLGGPS